MSLVTEACKLYPYQLVLLPEDVGNVHVVGGRGKIFQLLAGENIDGDEMDFSVTVLPGLGGRHLHNLARAALDDDVTVLPQGRALHRKGGGSAGVGTFESVLLMLWNRQ